VILLGAQPRTTRAFRYRMGPICPKFRRLFYKTSYTRPPQGNVRMYLHSENSPRYIQSAHKKPPQGCVDSALSPGAPAGHHTNSAISCNPCTATNWLCLVSVILTQHHLTLINSAKSCFASNYLPFAYLNSYNVSSSNHYRKSR
jgi:hypothetical protein